MKNSLRFLPFIGAALLLGPASVSAQVWNGAGSLGGSWDYTGNWTGGRPQSNEIAQFNTAGGGTVTMDASAAFDTVAGISFGTTAGAFIIRQNTTARTLTLKSITSASANDQLIDGSQLTLAWSNGTHTFAVNGTGDLTVAVGKALATGTSTHLTLAGTGTGLGTVSSVISGAGLLTVDGTATWALSGLNTRTGVTKLTGGVLSVATIGDGGVTSNLGAATSAATNLVFDGGTLRYTGATASSNRNFSITDGKTATIDVVANNLTFSGTDTAGTGGLTKTGAGTLTLNTATSHTGLTTVSAGTLAYGANDVLATGAVTVNGGTLAMGGFSDTVGNVTLAGGSITGATTLTTTGTSFEMQSGSVGVRLAGVGVALNKTTAGTVTLTGNNTYTGGTTISGGKLVLGTGGNVVGGIVNSGALGFDRSDNFTFNGLITGSGSVSIAGTGSVRLNSVNNYTGTSILSGGTHWTNFLGNSGTAPINSGHYGSLGEATTDVTKLVFDGGTLGVGAGLESSPSPFVSTDRGFTINAGKTAFINVATNVGFALSGNSAVTTGGLTKLGAGTLVLTGTKGYTGLTTVSEGTLQIGSSFSTLSYFAGNIHNQAALVLYGGVGVGSLSLPGVISGNGTVTIGSSGGAPNSIWPVVTFAGANTYSGLTTIRSGGQLQIGNGSGVGTGAVVNDGRLVFYRNDTSTFGNAISGSGALTLNGSGKVTLTAANTFSGPTTVQGGTLAFGASDVLGSGAVLVDGFAVLDLGHNHTDTVGTVTLALGSIIGTGNSALTSTGTFEMKKGTVGAILAGEGIALNKTTTGLVTLNGANTYTGLTTVSAGTLAYGRSDALASGGILVNGGILALGASHTDTVGMVTLAGGSITGTGTSALTTTGTFEMQHGSVGAILAGSGALNKTTAGTVTLSGANTYTGATSINAGLLVVNGSLGNTAVAVASGATLGGSGTIGGLVSLLGGSHLAAGNSPGTLTFAGGLSLDYGAILDFQLGTVSDLFRISGGVLSGPAGLGLTLNLSDAGGFDALAGGNFTLFDFTGASLSGFDVGDFTFGSLLAGTSLSNYSFAFLDSRLMLTIAGTRPPEPPVPSVPEAGSSAALLAASLAGLVSCRRRTCAAQG